MKTLIRLLRNLGLLLAGTLAALLVVEAGFRLVGAGKKKDSGARGDRPTFFYNREGARDLRDTISSPEKPPGSFRIAVVGDSFTFGPYLQVDDVFPKRLERMLNLNANAPKVEVINYGVPRYSTFHEVATTKQALAEGADLVILQVTLNDAEIKPYRPTHLPKGSVNRFGQVEMTEGIYRYWKTAAFVVTRLYNARSRQGYVDYHVRLFEGKKTWRNFADSVKAIDTHCRRVKVPLVAVVFPVFALPLDDGYPLVALHEKVGNYIASLSVPVLDLLPAYRGIPVYRLQMMPGKEFHPNEIANRIAAEAIYTWLEERRLFPEQARIKERFEDRLGIPREGEGTEP